MMFSGGDVYLKMLATRILQTFAALIGCLLLIVPGVILTTGFSQAEYYVADAGLGPIAAMRESWRVTDGQKLPLFGFALLARVIMVAGLFACCLGLFVSIPFGEIATAIVFVRMSGRGDATPFNGGGPVRKPIWNYGPSGTY
jgi:uncharacterized membrane protein